MAGRTPGEAIENYLARLQRAASCVTRAIFTTPNRSYQRVAEPIDLFLGSGAAVRLPGADRLHLRVRLRFRVVQAEGPRGLWEARTTAYELRLSDADDRELLAYHWHPDGTSHVGTPHLHLGPAAEVGRRALTAAHLPTGPVLLAEVVRLAVEGLGVAPLRRDWRRVLRESAAPAS